VAVAFGPGDTLNVFDLGNGKRSELIPGAREARSSRYVGGGAIVRVLRNNQLLVAFASASRFHIFDRDGNVVRSFGAPETPRPGLRASTSFISNELDGRFWSVVGKSYSLEEWSIDGRLLSRMRREASWLAPEIPISDGSLGSVPTAFVSDLRVDRQGRLWIVVNVPSATWRSGLGKVDTARGFSSYPQRDFSRLYDTLIEVIDLKSRRLLVSTRAKGYFRWIVSDTHLASLREGEYGGPLVDLWEVQVNASTVRQQ
jgi:hypothetical protein